MCDNESSKEILVELLNYLATCDVQIKKELVNLFSCYCDVFQVLKIANLAEKFSKPYAWYLDVILQVIRIAGDYVSDDIWLRVVTIKTNNDQEYAAKTVFKVLFESFIRLNCSGSQSRALAREYGKSGQLYSWKIWTPYF